MEDLIQQYRKYKDAYKQMRGGAKKVDCTNAAIILIKDDKIVMIKSKSKQQWMVPGGIVDKTDKSCFSAAAREFHEETGYELPKDTQLLHDIDDQFGTKLFILTTKSDIKFKENREASHLKLVSIDELRKSSFKTIANGEKVRACNIKSFRFLETMSYI